MPRNQHINRFTFAQLTYSRQFDNNIVMRSSSVDSSDSDNSAERERQFKRIYAKQLKKKQALEQKRQEKEREKEKNRPLLGPVKDQSKPEKENEILNCQQAIALPSMQTEKISNINYTPVQLRWFVYQKCPEIDLKKRVKYPICELPIFKKKDEILDSIIKNQVVLVTGETGCGKSTQVPRLIYQYLRNIGEHKAKIMCVQPRRLAVINLKDIMEGQMVEKNLIGYQIGMKSQIYTHNRIVFVTNGIFLQRMVHSTEFFEEYPFIILDQVHQRDIDTDFILLTIKRVMREYPKVRIILMSATIDNELFRYYFASDHIDNILSEENFYKRIIRTKFQTKKADSGDERENDSDSGKENKFYEANSYGFMKAKYPCPTINVTEPGKYVRDYYYLDSLSKFLPEGAVHNRWGAVIFNQKYPSTNKELFESVCLIIHQIARRHKNDKYKPSILIFMPGLGEIQNLSDNISQFFKSDRMRTEFEAIHVHSSILNDEITRKLHEAQSTRHKIIISTNIAQSSITVLGVKYVIDFCLSKEIRFDLKSRMENLELVWASKASCNQRAGRTGRVCDGTIFRLLEKNFYDMLPDYSTPEIQRSSLDKLILRIKLLHQGENNDIFADPGEVLGSAIQPPNLKNIDTALKSLQFCGGLEFRDDQFYLTNLGRLYIDIPIDITYCKLLVMSQLFGTFQDIVVLVAILSQSKNAIRKGVIERNYMQYYQKMANGDNCDFKSLIRLYRDTKKREVNNNIRLEVFREVEDLILDIKKRMSKKNALLATHQPSSQYETIIREIFHNSQNAEYRFRFKLTITCGFVENMLKVREASLDEKQEKRLKFMKKQNIPHKSTICLLGSTFLKKPDSEEAELKLKNHWIQNLKRTARLDKKIQMTVTYGMSYLHFDNEEDLNKFLFVKNMEENKRSYGDDNYNSESKKGLLSITDVLKCFGEMDHMHPGRPVTFYRENNVHIDNFSMNRVVNLNEGDNTKYLVANNIAKQSSRMVARYTSLLPSDIKYFEVLVNLVFYPFVKISCNKQKTRYDAVQIKKRHRIPIKYNLNRKEIDQVNAIRKIIREYLSMAPTQSAAQQFRYFNERLVQFVFADRQEVIEEERWQQVFMKQLFETRNDLKIAYEELLAKQSNEVMIDENQDQENEKVFMNQIKPTQLKQHFFSDIEIGGVTFEARNNQYNIWKLKKLREVREIQRRAFDKESYLACGQNSCGLRIAKLARVGPITSTNERFLYEVQGDNVSQMAFNQMDCHFCSLLMNTYIDREYKIFGCSNGHYFGVQFEKEKWLKIVPFSQLMVIYPDGSAEKAEFQRIQIKYWKQIHNRKLQDRYKIKLSTYCFICDEEVCNFKELEYHIQESKHRQNVEEFMKSIPVQMRGGTANVKVGVEVKQIKEDSAY